MLQNNEDTYLADTLHILVQEIGEDKQTLEDVAARLNLELRGWKLVLGSVSETVARLKANGRLVGYSPLSRLEEFELLAAGIVTKASLWRNCELSLAQRPGRPLAPPAAGTASSKRAPSTPGTARATCCTAST